MSTHNLKTKMYLKLCASNKQIKAAVTRYNDDNYYDDEKHTHTQTRNQTKKRKREPNDGKQCQQSRKLPNINKFIYIQILFVVFISWAGLLAVPSLIPLCVLCMSIFGFCFLHILNKHCLIIPRYVFFWFEHETGSAV